MRNLTATLFQKTTQLASLYQDLQVAQSAQKAIAEASSFDRIFARYGSESLSSLYKTTVSPALSRAGDLWQREIECATTVVNTIATLESFETQAAYGLFAGINRAGEAAQVGTETAVRWLSEHVGDMLIAQQSEARKSAARHAFDTGLSYVAGFGSRSVVTLLLGSFFGYYSPVIFLPFLLSRTVPDMLNAASEPISRNLGRTVFLNTYHGIAWAGNRGGHYTHEGMTAIGEFVQAAINRRRGCVDEARVQAFIALNKAQQKYVFEVVKESTQVDASMKREMEALGNPYFDEQSSLNEGIRRAFVEALLIAYDHLQPQDFLKITPAYFYQLDKRVQKRIRRAVKGSFPHIPLQTTEEMIERFNSLSQGARKSINKVTKEEFAALSPEAQYEFCFQVLHSVAYKNWYKEKNYDDLSFETLFSHIDPENPSITGKELNVLFTLYQEVGEGELADISPTTLAACGRARLMRFYEVLEKNHWEILSLIADSIDVDPESIPAILANNTPVDAVALLKRNRLIAAFASAYRTLPEYSQKLFSDTSSFEIKYMTLEEKKICLEFLIQKYPQQKDLLRPILPDIEFREPAHLDTIVSLFNALSDEDKAALHSLYVSQNHTLSYLTRSLVEEVKAIDTKLSRSSAEKNEAEQRIAEYTTLIDALKTTGSQGEAKKRIEAIVAQLQKANVLKNVRERELSYLLSARAEIEKLLREESITIQPCPIEQKVQPTLLSQTVCDLMIGSLQEKMFATTKLHDLEETFKKSKCELGVMIQNLQRDTALDAAAKDILTLLSQGHLKLEAAYEEHKLKLTGTKGELPPHFAIIVKGTEERFQQIEEVATLEKSHVEAITLVRDLANLLPKTAPSDIEKACREIDAIFATRHKALAPHHASWGIVRSLLPFMKVRH